MAFGAARALVRMARALADMPRSRRALEEGEISMSAARVLVQARETDPEAFLGSEDTLVEAARVHSTGDLHKVASYWRQAVDREAALDSEERLRERRRLHASTTFLGMVRVDGDLDPETGETLLTALRAVMDAEARSGQIDTRTAEQRRADALGEVCRQWLDHAERPEVAGERPHVTVLLDAEALRDGTGTSELDQAGPVDPELVRRLACDAGIARVVMAGRSEPLDVGRRTPVVPPAMRRAVAVRDRGMPVPGMRPASGVVRRPPRGALGGRGSHGAPEPGAAVPEAPQDGACPEGVQPPVGGWTAGVPGPARRCAGGGPGAALTRTAAEPAFTATRQKR
jgi:hypothetical protein